MRQALRRFVLALTGAGLMAGCVAPGPPNAHLGAPGTEAMSADQWMQTDFNRTVTVAMQANLDSLYVLLDKLYKRNPREWRKSGRTDHASAVQAARLAIDMRTPPQDLVGLRDIELLAVSLDADYQGDRVFALVYGLADTVITAHNERTRIYAFDVLNGAHVYNAARNVEAAAWLLSSRRDVHGRPLLLANEISPEFANLSFEREFGAVIGRLDLVSSLLGENTRRLGINYAQNLLFFAFLPVR